MRKNQGLLGRLQGIYTQIILPWTLVSSTRVTPEESRVTPEESRMTALESGRSMVEMLGVLAIIAVLTITSIMGYRYGIDKYAANTTITELERRAIVCNEQMLKGKKELVLNEFKSVTERGYPAAQYYLTDQYFEIELKNVPQGVCKQILKSGWQAFDAVYVNEIEATNNPDLCTTTNQISFEFEANLGQGAKPLEHCKTNADCSRSCDSCQKGICQSNCPSGKECAKDASSVSTYLCCAKEKELDGLCCSSVSTDENGQKTCCTNTNACCPTGYFGYRELGNNKLICRSCDDSNGYISWIGGSIDMYFCRVCPNRIFRAWECAPSCRADAYDGGDGFCHCKDPYAMQDKNGNCISCDNASENSYTWLPASPSDFSFCTMCNFKPNGGGYCNRCPNGTVAISGPGGRGDCIPCPTDITGLPSKSQCQSCGGKWNNANGSCSK